MKYSVSARQSKNIIEQADQIKIAYKDKGIIIDYIEQFPNKDFILMVPKGIDLNWDEIHTYAEKINLYLCLDNLGLATQCRDNGIKFYWSYPVFTWYDLTGLIELEPSYIVLGPPLSFELNKVQKKTAIPLRMCPNLSYDAYIPRGNGIYGSWIRPEDISVYDNYIDVCDFVTDNLSTEQGLLKAYKSGKWLGNLNLLLTNLNYNIDNRSLPEDIGKIRSVCGHRCMEESYCHYCETAFRFGDAIRKEHFNRLKKEKDKN